jgi:hypothetical protein
MQCILQAWSKKTCANRSRQSRFIRHSPFAKSKLFPALFWTWRPDDVHFNVSPCGVKSAIHRCILSEDSMNIGRGKVSYKDNYIDIYLSHTCAFIRLITGGLKNDFSIWYRLIFCRPAQNIQDGGHKVWTLYYSVQTGLNLLDENKNGNTTRKTVFIVTSIVNFLLLIIN